MGQWKWRRCRRRGLRRKRERGTLVSLPFFGGSECSESGKWEYGTSVVRRWEGII